MKGFTLLEVLVVASITVIITGLFIQNFSRSRIDLNQTTLTIVDAIRDAQSQALAGALYAGKYRCGYGIHFNASDYLIYAGPDVQAVGIDCSTQDSNYNASIDSVVRQGLLSNNVLEIVATEDIFFEPPDPTTFIGGVSTPGKTTLINIRRKSAACPSSDCRTISVTTSGRIQTQ